MADDDPATRLANLEENMKNLKRKFIERKITFKDYTTQAIPIQKAMEATRALMPESSEPRDWIAAKNERADP